VEHRPSKSQRTATDKNDRNSSLEGKQNAIIILIIIQTIDDYRTLLSSGNEFG